MEDAKSPKAGKVVIEFEARGLSDVREELKRTAEAARELEDAISGICSLIGSPYQGVRELARDLSREVERQAKDVLSDEN